MYITTHHPETVLYGIHGLSLEEYCQLIECLFKRGYAVDVMLAEKLQKVLK